MAAPELVLYDSAGVAIVPPITLAQATRGTAGTALTLRLQNDGDAAAPRPRIRAVAYDDEAAEYVASGKRAVDERWTEIQATGNSTSTAGQVASGWRPTGRGRWLELAALEAGEYHEIEARLNPPGTASPVAQQLGFDAEPGSTLTPLDAGHTETGADGVLSAVGDRARSELVIGGPITASSPEAATVETPDLYWGHLGIPRVRLAATDALDDTDGDSATLGAGEGYYARLSLGTSLTVTKGSKAAVAAPPEVPGVPEGETDLGYVLRDDTGTISAADVTSDPVVGRFALAVSGANIILGPGRALVGNSLSEVVIDSPLSLPLSSSHHVWRTDDGAFASSQDGSAPTPLSKLLYTLDSDGSGPDLATLVDHRGLPPTAETFAVQLDATAGAQARWINATRRRWYVVAADLALVAGTPGAGNAAGSLVVDVLLDGVSLFTSAGTDDRRLGLSLDEGEDTRETRGANPLCLPEVLTIEPWQVLTFVVSVPVAFDVAAPSGLMVLWAMERG
jgi:hypothetical protein